MRHFFLSSLLLIFISIGCKYNKKTIVVEEPFRIIGTIDDLNIENLIFKYYRCEKDSLVIDTVSIINCSFKIEGVISPRSSAYVYIDNNEISFYLDPGEMHLYLKKDSLEDFILKGSKTQIYKEKMKFQTKPLEDYLIEINKNISLEQNEFYKNFLINQKDSISILLENIRIDFVKSNPTSHYSLDEIFELLFNQNQSTDVLTSLFDGLSENVRVSCMGKQLYGYILQRKKSSMKNISYLESIDKDGKLIKISDFEGKYILIDFWATWCIPCINGFPHIKELYTKYKDKGLVIINVSIDKEKDEHKCLNVIAKYEIMEWINILYSQNSGENNICDIHETLPGSTIPHYILIDKSGNIIKHWRGFDETVAKEQNEMFANIFENKK